MKKAYFVTDKASGGFKFVGFHISFEDAYRANIDVNGFPFSDDDLYKMIDAAKDALNNIPLDQK